MGATFFAWFTSWPALFFSIFLLRFCGCPPLSKKKILEPGVGEWKKNHISNAWLCLVHHNNWFDLIFQTRPGTNSMIPGDVTPWWLFFPLHWTNAKLSVYSWKSYYDCLFKTKEDVTLQKTKISLSCQVSGPQQSIDDGLYIKALQVAVSLPSAHEHNRLASGVRHGDSSTNLTKVIKVAMVKHQRQLLAD